MASNLGQIRSHSILLWNFLTYLRLFTGNVLHEALLLVYDAHVVSSFFQGLSPLRGDSLTYYVLSSPQHFSVTTGVDGD
jgi:hypothetical protein